MLGTAEHGAHAVPKRGRAFVVIEGLYRRGKVWWLRYSYGGKQVRQSAETTNKKEAEAALAKIRSEIFAGTFFPEKRKTELTIGELRDQWLEHAKHKRSVKDDASRFGRIIEFFGKQRAVATIDSADIGELRDALLDEKTRRGVMSPATANRHLALLRSALRYADAQGFLTRRPTVKLNAEDNERDRICTPEEYERLVAEASPSLRLAIVLGYWSGMRLGEITSLRWEQLDLKAGVAKLRARDTKTKQAREVPLPAPAIEALKAAPRALDGGLVFMTDVHRKVGPPRRTHLKSTSLSPLFSRLVRSLGIKDLRFHDLRHTAATRLRRAGVDVLTIQRITGHKTLQMLARYNTITSADLQAAMAKAEAVEAKENAQ